MNFLNSFSPIHHRSCRLITCLMRHTITMFNGPLDFGQWVTPFGQLSAIHQLDHALWAHPRNDGYALDRYRMKERNFFASINCCRKFISSFRAIESLFGTLWFDWRTPGGVILNAAIWLVEAVGAGWCVSKIFPCLWSCAPFSVFQTTWNPGLCHFDGGHALPINFACCGCWAMGLFSR